MNSQDKTSLSRSSATSSSQNDTVDLNNILEIILDQRRLIFAVAAIFAFVGICFSQLSTPTYQANVLIQVEDGGASSAHMLGDIGNVLASNSAATAEMEILRSRYVIGRAVRNAGLDLTIQPNRFPILGNWISRKTTTTPKAGLFGIGGYTWGAEKARLSIFDIPEPLLGRSFKLTALGDEKFQLAEHQSGLSITGVTGRYTEFPIPQGTLRIKVEKLEASKGATFTVTRRPMLAVIEELQNSLVIAEKGKQSGIIGLSLAGGDPELIVRTLNEIGNEYVRQNVERKSEAARTSLEFLERQLPDMKRKLEAAEVEYNSLRNRRGTIDLTEEAKVVLQQSIGLQAKLVELRQKRDDLSTRFQPNNPLVTSVDQQMRSVEQEIASITAKIKRMPETEQDILRLTRDIKVNTDLYTSLLNSAQQLRLVKASKVGNAHLLDEAVAPREPASPRHKIVVGVSIVLGLVLGLASALVKKYYFGGVDDPGEIEQKLGLTVAAAIPHSHQQTVVAKQINIQAPKLSVLASESPDDLAVESLRSLRTSLQFSLLGAKNNVIMITGPAPGVGKSFISVNLAVVMASTGKKILLIDADLRKGYLQKYFGISRNGGLAEVLSGSVAIEQCIRTQVVENLDFIPTGTLPARPAELLMDSNLGGALSKIQQLYDYVIIDTAPVLAVTDAMIIAPYVGSIFNVIRGGITRIGEIEECIKRISLAGGSVSGWVFNDLKNSNRKYGFGSRYGRYRYTTYKY